MNAQQFLVKVLKEDPVLKARVSARIWPMKVPSHVDENVPENIPFIVYQEISRVESVMKFPTIQLRLVSDKYSDLADLETEVRRIFDSYSKYRDDDISIEAITVKFLLESEDDSLSKDLLARLLEVQFALRS